MLSLERKGDRLVAYISGELDHHNAGGVRDKIDEFAAAFQPEHAVLDFGGVSFMDSSGVGMIIGRYMKVKYSGGKVSVAGVSDGIDRILRMSGVYKIISKYDSVRDALMQS